MRPTKKRTVGVERPGQRQKRTVAIIGGGRLGTALGIALREAGYAIDFVASSRAASARKSARLIGGATKAFPINQVKPAALTKIATLIIATPDDAVASVANELAGMLPKRPSGGKRQRVSTIALHTSGALSSGVLRPLQARGLATGS